VSSRTGAPPAKPVRRAGHGAHSSAVANGANRRETPRIETAHVEAEIVSLGLKVTVLEVGFGGLSIASEREFPTGDTLELLCRTPGHRSAFLRVRVMHCRPEDEDRDPTRYITGFQFVDPWRPGDCSALDTFIAQIAKVLSVESKR